MEPTVRTPYQRVKDLLRHPLIEPRENNLGIVWALKYKVRPTKLAAFEARLLRLIDEREQALSQAA